ncbi:MAG: hypothetical protein QOJ11_2843 [Frankiales bacterium]|jgi:hypothetical protein|nr:hypothetical protein [Frankiales bacterium]
MSRHRSLVRRAELALAALTVLVGWADVVGQLRSGSGRGDGDGWLLGFAVVATLGLTVLLVAQRHGRHLYAALALVLVAVSPTVFAYPLNLAILALVVVELFRSVAGRARRA